MSKPKLDEELQYYGEMIIAYNRVWLKLSDVARKGDKIFQRHTNAMSEEIRTLLKKELGEDVASRLEGFPGSKFQNYDELEDFIRDDINSLMPEWLEKEED